ncbi:hypothetical protein BFJ66_g17322 [Fusarium oxysporum f. sp. cepae]|uniref:Secreted in xylem 14 n=1 Tax=Fusarium oxysporum f. sp. cepae TaxID=396571 RepID=A0A3L6N210_FUSOX|nr:hypothetical protein BFJ65_g14413 [Fusarium oxysporum f. sp. cepae]RKK11012.1 hypothetical protein BFJ65_g15004 [Fusarium oxysporum f. sp. cepae]RKK21570.1 hypothetical protein BFJ67_g17202 [Fusarium oxysporum f. sp. cepae]RKK23881.1 hypothetical protein BFJ66_g17322 [Fusarium oxysporum f. sp. cepae]
MQFALFFLTFIGYTSATTWCVQCVQNGRVTGYTPVCCSYAGGSLSNNICRITDFTGFNPVDKKFGPCCTASNTRKGYSTNYLDDC